jgi:hypothetical protein
MEAEVTKIGGGLDQKIGKERRRMEKTNVRKADILEEINRTA